MAKAGLTIAISGTYNGRAIEKARQDLEKMRISAVNELGGAGSSLTSFGSTLAEVGGEIHNVGYKMEQIGSKATRGITLPIIGAAAAVGSAAIEMDTSLTNVKKTVDGTEEQYQQLKDAAIEFSKTNAVSASQIMDIQSLGAQLGFTIDELDEFSRVVSGLDIATNMDAETAGTEMAQFANITKMAHSEVSNYGSAIVGLGNNMATTESDISHMAMRLAAAGTQVGMSQADILGLAAALSSMGVEAEAGGTAISTIMSQIDKDIATGSDAVETWAKTAGMSANDFADAWKKDPVQALSALLSNMEKTTAEGGNMSVMLEELGIDSIRQTDIMKRLAGNSDLVTKAVKLSNDEWKKNTALSNEVNNRNASMAAKFQILLNKVTAVAEKVGTPLVNALLDVVDAAEPLIEGIGDAAQAFADMDEKDQKMILGLVAAVAAFGPVTSVAGKLTQGVGNLVVGIGKGAQSLGVLKNELSLVKGVTSATCGPTLSFGKAVTTLGADKLPMLSGALGVLKTAFIGLGIGAAVVAIGAVVTAIKNVIDHEQKVVDATYGLETAMGAAGDAYNSYVGGAESCAKSLGDIKARTEEVIESQGKLAQSMADQWAEYGTNAAMVDAYAGEIKKLTEKYDEHGNKVALTAEEQTRLKLAVDGFNEATGSSIQVTDALNGTLNTSIDTIMASAEAFKEQARAQAAIEMYKDLYKQQLQDEMALNDATEELNRLKALEADAWAYSMDGINPYTAQVADAQKQVDDLTKAMESNVKTQDQLINVIMGTGKSFDSFDSALEQSGISLEDFGSLTDEQLTSLKSNFDGKLSSIVTTCNEKGIEIPQSLADAISENKEPVNEAATGLGADVDAGIQKGIEDNADKPKSGIEAVGDGIINFFKDLFGIHSPSTVMAELGADIDLGLKQGIDDKKGEPQSAVDTLGKLLQGAIEGLPDWMKGLGADAGTLLSDGISSLENTVKSAGDTLYKAGQTGANPIIDALGRIGDDAASSMVDNLNAMQDSAQTAGGNLYSSAYNGLSPVISDYSSVGNDAASDFSNAIGNTSAYYDGQSLASSARDGLSSIETYNTGWNFAVGFSNGMNGVDIWTAAWNIGCSALDAIKSALGISSPSKEAAKVGEWFGEGAVKGMKSTEGDIAAEAERMSDAMTLNPSQNAYGSGYARSYQSQAGGARQITFNVTINVAARDEQQAIGIGSSIGEQLYLEFARRERAYA